MIINSIIDEFQKKYPTKEEKEKALKNMSSKEIQKLIDASTNTNGKIFYSKFLK